MAIVAKSQDVSPTAPVARRPGRPRSAEKETAIVEAAQHLFMERGFEGASVDAIADAAGVSKATVYARFGDKEALLATAIRTKCASFLDEALNLAHMPAGTFRERLIILGQRFLALVTDGDAVAMHRLMMNEMERNSHLPQLFFDTAIVPTLTRFSKLIEDETRKGTIAVADPVEAAWQFLGMVKGEDHMRAMFGLPLRSADAVRRHVTACVDVFLAAHKPAADQNDA